MHHKMIKFKNVTEGQMTALLASSPSVAGIGPTNLRYRYDIANGKLFIQVLSDNVKDHAFREYVRTTLIAAEQGSLTVLAADDPSDPPPIDPPTDPGSDGFSGVETNGIWQ